MNNPGEAHYIALKQLAQYWVATKSDGIHYWRRQPHPTLPDSPPPAFHANNYDIKETRGTNSTNLVGFVDSSWATNTKERTSMTGMILMYSGGAIGYKSKF